MKIYKFANYKHFYDPGYYTLYQLSKNWTESGANWEKNTGTTTWTTTGGDFMPAAIDSFKYDGKLNNAWFSYNVTNAVAEMVKNPVSNFGFIIKITGFTDSTKPLYHESHFHSSEATNASLTPRLIVIGSPSASVATEAPMRHLFRVRCSNNAVTVCLPRQTSCSFAVTDYRGRMLYRNTFIGTANWVRIPYGFARGVYCITVQSTGGIQTRKVTVF